jgi:hypothetical protein
LAARGSKVALLIEDVVKGEQTLVLLEKELALIEEDGGVEGGFAVVVIRFERDAGENGGWERCGCEGEFVDGGTAAS